MSRSAESRARTSAALRAFHARNPDAFKGLGAGQPKSAEHRANLAAAVKRNAAERQEAIWVELEATGPDCCWEWPHQFANGYGRIAGRKAHRVSWERTFGPVPKGLLVLHRCDNPPCVNPAHLYIGTHADNARDRKLRDRGVKGRRVNTNKLTEEDVYAIRGACDSGERQADIARRFGVTQPMVGFIARRESWAWLPENPT